MATDKEILDDIQNIYRKIDQCYKAKEDLATQIAKEQDDMVALSIFMKTDVERIAEGKKPRYDNESMQANIERCKNNIQLFRDTIVKEDATINEFRNVVKVLQDDMARPKELVIDMTGK